MTLTHPTKVLQVASLTTQFATHKGRAKPVDSVTFDLCQGQTLALVGESGSGKSVTALSIMGLIPPHLGHVAAGQVRFKGKDLVQQSPQAMQHIRGKEIAMIFQDPMSSLNPVLTIGQQIVEVLTHHGIMEGEAATARTVALLARVGIPDPAQKLGYYPHQFSGGMCQRVMIAIALACNPSLLIADEPTTALDPPIQAQIVALLKELQQELGMAILFITHDLGLVTHLAHHVAVMYCGRIVEHAPVHTLFEAPRHPYTQGLLRSIPHLQPLHGNAKPRLHAIPGIVPPLAQLPPGCAFQARCAHVQPSCRGPQGIPPLYTLQPEHQVACYYPPKAASPA